MTQPRESISVPSKTSRGTTVFNTKITDQRRTPAAEPTQETPPTPLEQWRQYAASKASKKRR